MKDTKECLEEMLTKVILLALWGTLTAKNDQGRSGQQVAVRNPGETSY